MLDDGRLILFLFGLPCALLLQLRAKPVGQRWFRPLYSRAPDRLDSRFLFSNFARTELP